VHDDIALAVGRFVNGLQLDLDAAKALPRILTQSVVVVAGNEYDARALAHLAEDLLQDIIVGLGPDRAAANTPEVDDVADKVDRIGVMLTQKIEQQLRITGRCAEMDVRYKQRSILGHGFSSPCKPGRRFPKCVLAQVFRIQVAGV